MCQSIVIILLGVQQAASNGNDTLSAINATGTKPSVVATTGMQYIHTVMLCFLSQWKCIVGDLKINYAPKIEHYDVEQCSKMLLRNATYHST